MRATHLHARFMRHIFGWWSVAGLTALLFIAVSALPAHAGCGSIIRTADPNPEKFAIYVAGANKVSLGNSSSFYGVIYAPMASVVLNGSGELFGAFIGGSVSLGASSRVHYDSTLRGH